MNTKTREITGFGLKLIAVITMFIDHIGAGILENTAVFSMPTAEAIQDQGTAIMMLVDLLLRSIGRMAFPIYCYMLAEGFVHTRNVKKYGLRLLAIAIVSELPFDYLFDRQWFSWGHNNVLWELLLGLIVIYGIVFVQKQDMNAWLKFVLKIVVMGAGMAIAELTNLDYGMAGICAIAVMYNLNGEEKKKRLLAFGLGIVVLTLMSSVLEVCALFMLIPMSYYQGNRGPDSPMIRRFFYWFYPAHIVLLGAISYCIL